MKVTDLSDCFQILALEKTYSKLRGKLDSESIFQFVCDTHPTSLEANVFFHSDSRLDADSNLWPNVYERECKKVELDCSKIDEERTRVKTLVARRNSIAHGNKMIVNSLSEYLIYEDTMLAIMHDLAVQIVDLIDDQKFLKTTVATAD